MERIDGQDISINGLRGGRNMEFTGDVTAGVEHRSVVLLTDDGSQYQLGGSYMQYIGRRVTVSGRVRPDVMTITMQGVVLAVEAIVDHGPSFRSDLP